MPLTMRALLNAAGEFAPLRYEHWIIYQLHIGLHQAGFWAGEIEEMALRLKSDPSFRLP